MYCRASSSAAVAEEVKEENQNKIIILALQEEPQEKPEMERQGLVAVAVELDMVAAEVAAKGRWVATLLREGPEAMVEAVDILSISHIN